MIGRRSRRVLAAATVLMAVGCGKRGNPLPPLRPVPGPIGDLSVYRRADRIELRFTVPATNVDGTTPVVVDRVEVFGVVASADAPPPTAATLMTDSKNRRGEVRVHLPGPGAPPTTEPAPGGGAVFVDRPASPVNDAVAYYAVVGVTAGTRGRLGPPSALVTLPLGALPSMVDPPTVTNDETKVRVAWQTSAGFRYLVFRRSGEGTSEAVNDAPVEEGRVELPVAFGREQCFFVTPLAVSGRATTEGTPSPAACLTAVDRYPPPAPTRFEAVQEAAGVTLSWTAVEASDLAGYVVLRGEGAGETMQPLMRTPTTATTYVDATAQPGVTYTYSVYAVDTAPVPNVSQQSNRQSITFR